MPPSLGLTPEQMRERRNARVREWRRLNPETHRACVRSWKKRNREQTLEATRKWFDAHPEYKKQWRYKNIESEAKYAERGRERKRITNARWQTENKDRRAVNEQRRRARKANAGGEGITVEQWQNIKADYSHLCAYCGERKPLELDHIDPLSRGGLHDIENAAPACERCNTSKGNRTFIAWLATARRRVRQ